MVDEETAQDIEDLMTDIRDAMIDMGLRKDDSIGALLDSLNGALEECGDTDSSGE
jgi:hypothetical protein